MFHYIIRDVAGDFFTNNTNLIVASVLAFFLFVSFIHYIRKSPRLRAVLVTFFILASTVWVGVTAYFYLYTPNAMKVAL